MQFIDKVAQLTAAERIFAARAWLLAPVVEASLYATGLDTTMRWIERAPRRRRAAAVDPIRGEGLVGTAFRYHPLLRGTCLARSVAQYVLHRSDGTRATLVVGVRRQGADLKAHSWVEPTASAPPDGPYEPILRAESVP